MVFEIGKCYRHLTGKGKEIHILGEINSTLYGKCFVAETNDCNCSLIPVGKDESNAVNWVEITKEQWLKNFSE